MPKILRVDPAQPDSRAIDQVVSALARGELVVIPTETVYGLAADPRVPGAVDKIYGAKERPETKPVAFLAADLEQVRARGAVIELPAVRLIRRFWPGPMTLVLKTPAGFVGFRVPDYPVTLSLLWKAGSVLAATSANRSGNEPALTAAEAVAALGEWISLALDAGTSPGGMPSTVVKVDGEKVDVLREGAIRRDEIMRVAGVGGSGGSPSSSSILF